MRNVPKHIQQAAERIGNKVGLSAQAVIARFTASVKKSSYTAQDFLCGHSDISLSASQEK